MDRPRIARPGDVCVLVEPSAREIADLRQRQMSLQALFGGRPQERVHLTCQRFELSDERLLPSVMRRLRSELAAVRPFPVVAVSLVQLAHPFWGSRLLRWGIRGSDDLRRLGMIVEGALVALGITPHFSAASGWGPTHVTALEAVPEADLDRYRGDVAFPHQLFVARHVVLSLIKGRGQFEILGAIRLSESRHLGV
jgi:hypothetical protein